MNQSTKNQTMTLAEYREYQRSGTWPERMKRKGRNKYGAKKADSTLAGRSFDSQMERSRAEQLVLMEKAGEISELQFQVQTHMTRARIGYKVDFVYQEQGRTIYEEAKGFETPVWRIKRRLWKWYGPGLLRVVKKGGGGFVVSEEIRPKGAFDFTENNS